MRDRTLVLLIGTLSLAGAARMHAFPTFGANCAGCHAPTTGKMTVSGEDSTVTLSLRLDGKPSAPEKTYNVAPGGTVRLSETVLDGSQPYALTLSGFDTAKGLKVSQSDSLLWSAPSAAAQGWTQGAGSPTYFYSSIFSDGLTRTLNFDLTVDNATPADFYELTFGIAGGPSGSQFSQQESFYLNVAPIPEPSVFALAGLGVLSVGGARRFGKKTGS